MNKELRTIMLVEDEPDILEIARLALEATAPYTVHTCNSGQKAIDSAPQIKPDLIVLDMMMPGMDGLTTLKLLRENTELQDIPIIFMTAKAQNNEIKRYIESGALGVISKPFDPMHLADEILQIWGKTQ
jgi:two-component system OmpR family response regulator